MTDEQNKSPPAHTTLPWLYDEQTFEIYIPDDEHEPCDVVADMEVLKTPRHHAHANGEFIVRACNSHYQMLDVLERAEMLVGGYVETDVLPDMCHFVEVLEGFRAAIAKARGHQ
jgi:hypothetical protein